MTNKITDLENQPQPQPQQHTSSILSQDLAELQPLSEEELSILKELALLQPLSVEELERVVHILKDIQSY